jgi:hypothetical protein
MLNLPTRITRPIRAAQTRLCFWSAVGAESSKPPAQESVVETTHCKQHRFGSSAMVSSKQVVLCALIIDLLPAPLFAQRPRMSYKTAPVMVPTTPDDRVVVASLVFTHLNFGSSAVRQSYRRFSQVAGVIRLARPARMAARRREPIIRRAGRVGLVKLYLRSKSLMRWGRSSGHAPRGFG